MTSHRFAGRLAIVTALIAATMVASGCAPQMEVERQERALAIDRVSDAQGLEAQGKWDAALAQYDAMLRAPDAGPRQVPALQLGRARCLSQLGRRGEALQAVEGFLKQSPDHREAKILREKLVANSPAPASLSVTTSLSVVPAAQVGATPSATSPARTTAPTHEPPAPVGNVSSDAAAANPAATRYGSVPYRREKAGIKSPADEPSQVDVALVKEAVAKYDPEKDRRTVGEVREMIGKDAVRQPLPSDADISKTFFGVGPAKVETMLPARNTAGDSRYYIDRAQSLIAEGHFAQARRALEEAMDRNPRDGAAMVELGALLERMGEPERAKPLFEEATKVTPDQARAFYRLGNAHVRLGLVNARTPSFNDAIVAYDRALALDPQYLFALHNKGVALMELKRFDEAEAIFQRVVAMDPNYNPTYRNLGIIAEKHDNDPIRALGFYRRYLDLNGQDKDNVTSWMRELERKAAGK